METQQSHKSHHKSDKGRKASEKKKKSLKLKKGQFDEEDARKRNPKAFAPTQFKLRNERLRHGGRREPRVPVVWSEHSFA